ncbi:MAG TPA: hypothetical protein VMS71_00370, partial [Candidatus Acidoferrum sp.]|nr:hypothetical protein [Candidatus Acidoferrum sp.]
LGLNDVAIAHRKVDDMGSGMAGHEKGDGAYVLSRRPALIQFSSSIGGVQPYFRSDIELYDNPVFHEQYSLKTVWIPDIMMRVAFYVRNDFPFPFQ